MNKRQCHLLLVAILVFTGVLCWSSLTTGHDWGGDSSAYIMQAKSLVEGRPLDFIENNRFAVRESSYPVGPAAYPWGFPALLAPVYAIFGVDMMALKSVGAICFVLFILLLWLGFRKYHSEFWCVVLIGLFALNPTLLWFMNSILSDIPFLLFSTLSVLLIGAGVIEKRQWISPVIDKLILSVCIAAACFIRTNGILLLVTLAITQLIDWRQRTQRHKQIPNRESACGKHAAVRCCLIGMLPYVVVLSLLAAGQLILPVDETSHLSFLSRISAQLVMHNLQYYMKLPAEFFVSVPFHHIVYVLTIALATVGVIRRYKTDYHVLVYVALTLGIYLLWPSTQGLRFLLPVLPFYLSFMLTGIQSLKQVGSGWRRALRNTMCALPVVVILCFAVQSGSDIFHNLNQNREMRLGPFTETSQSMFSFIKQDTHAQSTIAFFKPRVMRMMTNRKSLMINNINDLPRLTRGDYLCLYMRSDAFDQIKPDQTIALLEQDVYHLTFRNKDFIVLRAVKDP